MTDHLGRLVGTVLVSMAIVLGRCPPARAQRDVDRDLKQAMDEWRAGTPASRERAVYLIAALGHDARPAAPLLLGSLRDPNPAIRIMAAQTLGYVEPAGKDGITALTALLNDPKPGVRDAAARVLAQFGWRAASALDALTQSLRAPPDRRCLRAAAALASIGAPALPALIDLLTADDPALRRAVLEGIGESMQTGWWHHGRTANRALGRYYLVLARDPDPAVRRLLASVLIATKSDEPSLISALRLLLRDPNPGIRLAVAHSVKTHAHLPIELRGAFLELLKDDDIDLRIEAAEGIPYRDLGAPEVIDRLLVALQDRNPRLRAAAADRLAVARHTLDDTDPQGRPITFIWTSSALTRHPAAGRILVSALNDSRPDVRAAAAGLLLAFPVEASAAIPRLKEALADDSPAVRAAADATLAQLGPASASAVRPLFGVLANPDDGSREAHDASFNAARALAAIGDEARAKALRLLAGQLNSLDEGVRRRAEQIIVAMGPKVAVDLFRMLSDAKSSRHIQVEALGLLYTLLTQSEPVLSTSTGRPAPEAIAAIRSLTRDPDPEVQLETAALLAAFDQESPAAAELYLDYLRSGMNPDLSGVWLAWVARPGMIPTLTQGLGDPDGRVRYETASALSNLAKRLAAEDQDNPVYGQATSVKASSLAVRRRLQAQAARALLPALRDGDVRVRWIAAESLGVLHVPADTVVPALVATARTDTGRIPREEIVYHPFQADYPLGQSKVGDQVRVAAIRALGGFGREAAAAVPDLIRALRDEDLRIRWFASEALALIGPDAKAAVPVLVEALRGRDVAPGQTQQGQEGMNDGPIRLMAAFALGRIGPEARAAIPDLIAALSGPVSRVRGEAARALGLIGPDARAAVPDLVRLVTRGTVGQVAQWAADALSRLGPAAVPALVEEFRDDDPEVRASVLGILGRTDPATDLPIDRILRAIRDPDPRVRQAAAMALVGPGGRLKTATAVPRLAIALWDEDEEVANAAARILIAAGSPVVPTLIEFLHTAYPQEGDSPPGFDLVVIRREP